MSPLGLHQTHELFEMLSSKIMINLVNENHNEVKFKNMINFVIYNHNEWCPLDGEGYYLLSQPYLW